MNRERTDSLGFKSDQHLYIPFGLSNGKRERQYKLKFKFRHLTQPLLEDTIESINKSKSILKPKKEEDRSTSKHVKFRDTTNILTTDGYYVKDRIIDGKKRLSRRIIHSKNMKSVN